MTAPTEGGGWAADPAKAYPYTTPEEIVDALAAIEQREALLDVIADAMLVSPGMGGPKERIGDAYTPAGCAVVILAAIERAGFDLCRHPTEVAEP